MNRPQEQMKDKQEEILNAIKDANQKFKADLELAGSWAEQGFSGHDIDVVTNRGGKEAVDAAKYIAKKTGMLVDVFLSWVWFPRLDRNVWVFPDGKWGYGIDFMMERLTEELSEGMKAPNQDAPLQNDSESHEDTDEAE